MSVARLALDQGGATPRRAAQSGRRL